MRKVVGALVAVAVATVLVSQVMLWTEVRALRRRVDHAAGTTPGDRAIPQTQRAERTQFLPHTKTALTEPPANNLTARLDEIETRMRATPGFESPDEMSDVALLAHARKTVDPEAGLVYYDQFVNRFPDHPELKRALHGAMRSAVEARNWFLVDEYADRLQRAGQLSAQDEGDALFFKALAHQQQGNLEAARPLYEQAAVVGRGQYVEANVYLVLGRMYLATDPELARKYFTTLIERFKNKGIADDLVTLAVRDLASLGK